MPLRDYKTISSYPSERRKEFHVLLFLVVVPLGGDSLQIRANEVWNEDDKLERKWTCKGEQRRKDLLAVLLVRPIV